MQLTRRALLGTGVGLAGSRPALAALFQRASPGIGYVTPKAFGAVPNDPRAAQANVPAFNAMAQHALRSGLEMIIPAGVWYLWADGRKGSGWMVRPMPGRPCLIRGEGAASQIRRAPTQTASKFASMIRLWVTTGGESFDLQGLSIDGNEEAFPFDSADPWAYQQSHCVELACLTRDKAAASLRIRDLSFSGVVADGLKVGAQCQNFDAQRVTASGRRRRHRSDIQFSRLPKLATVSDCTVDAFESEPSDMVPGATMRIRNLVARSTLDLAGPEDDPAGRLKVEADNCQCGTMRTPGVAVNTTSIYRVDGSFTNCSFATAPASPSRNNMLRASALRFEGCHFTIAPAIGGGPASSPLYAYFERPEDHVEIVDSSFDAQPAARHGAYLIAGGRSQASILQLRNCETARPLDHVVELPWRASVHLSGGVLRARKAIVEVGPRAKGSSVSFDHQQDWSAPELLSQKSR